MDVSLWLIYTGTFLVALAAALAFVPVARSLAFRFGVLDHPGGYKQQAEPIPYLGGVAVAAATISAVVGAGLMGLGISPGQAGLVLGMAAVLVVVGLADDVLHLPLSPRVVAQTAAAIAVILLGTRVQLFDSVVLEVLLTAVWVVGITNGLNLLDNMDGLAAGVAAIGSGWLFVIAASNGQFLVSTLLVALLGAVLGFLRYNVHPARIYLGDAGSLFLGFLLAVAGMRLNFGDPVRFTWLIPVVALGVPILDTSFVTVTRLRRGASPFNGARDHISHRLVALGMSVRGAVGVLGAAAFIFGFVAFVISRNPDLTAYALAAGVFGSGLVGLLWLERRTSPLVETPPTGPGPMREESA